MSSTLDAITENVFKNYPLFLEDAKISHYYFWDCTKNEEIPPREIKDVKNYLEIHKIKDFALVIVFSDNIIGYRLKV